MVFGGVPKLETQTFVAMINFVASNCNIQVNSREENAVAFHFIPFPRA